MSDCKFNVGDEVVFYDSRRSHVSAVQVVSKVHKNGNFTIGDSRDQYSQNGSRAGRHDPWPTISIKHAADPSVERARRVMRFRELVARLRRMTDSVSQGDEVPPSTLEALCSAVDDLDARLRKLGWGG